MRTLFGTASLACAAAVMQGCCITLPENFGESLAWALATDPGYQAQQAWPVVAETHDEVWMVSPAAEGAGLELTLAYTGDDARERPFAPERSEDAAAIIAKAAGPGGFDGTPDAVVRIIESRPDAALLVNFAQVYANERHAPSTAAASGEDAYFDAYAEQLREVAAQSDRMGEVVSRLHLSGWIWAANERGDEVPALIRAEHDEASPNSEAEGAGRG